MRLDIYAARTETARNRANAAIKRIAVANAQFAELGNALDKARHKDKEIEVLNEREAIASALESIAVFLESGDIAEALAARAELQTIAKSIVSQSLAETLASAFGDKPPVDTEQAAFATLINRAEDAFSAAPIIKDEVAKVKGQKK